MVMKKVIDVQELLSLPREFAQTFSPKNIRAKGYPLWTLRGDSSAFVALFMDNLATQLSLAGIIIGAGMPASFVWGKFFGGVGISLLFGNLYYSLQASKVAMRTGKMDTCAQPYGINTPGAIAKTFGVLLPVFLATQDAKKAWETACVANFFGGLFEFLGALIAPFIAKNIPQPAFLVPIGGIGMTWLGINPLVSGILGSHDAHNPIVGFLPFIIIWVSFFATPSRGLFGRFIPAAFVAVVLGIVLNLLAQTADFPLYREAVQDSTEFLKWQGIAIPGWSQARTAFQEYGNLVLGLAFTNFIGTYACNISARKGGDLFPVMESMMVDGMGSMIGALCGSPYGTTVYIGHVAYKKMGATRGYSL
jgi:AGZA family xanthine/uracil permease-like MFS transporter